MLHEILTIYRTELIDRCRAKVALRTSPKVTAEELTFGVSYFLEQLIGSLRAQEVAGPRPGPRDDGSSALEEVAALHGGELLRHGFTVDQVVHDYGDVCQAVTDLAFERGLPISVDEFRTLNRCLDNAIAGAVTQFMQEHDCEIADRRAFQLSKRQGFFAHELRNLINTATLAVGAIKLGKVGLTGATGAVLDRSLAGLRVLVERSISEVRATNRPPPPRSIRCFRFTSSSRRSRSPPSSKPRRALAPSPSGRWIPSWRSPRTATCLPRRSTTCC